MNAFDELAQQIELWDKKSGNTAKRRMEEKRGIARWDTTRVAFRWLVEIDKLSEGKANREHLLDALWAHMVQPDQGWKSPDGRSRALGASELEHLKTLAEVHHVDPDEAHTLSPQEISTLRETMELIRSDLIKHGEVLGQSGKRLQTLVNSCLELLGKDDIDDAAVRASTEQIFGAVIPASYRIEDEEERRGFVGKAARALGIWTSDVASNASGSVAGQWIIGMLTGAG